MILIRISIFILFFWCTASNGTAWAESRDVCTDGSAPKGTIVAVNGDVTIVGVSGKVFKAASGYSICALYKIETGSLSRVEFRLTGRNTTTGSSSNSVTIIPKNATDCVELKGGLHSFISSVFQTQCFKTPLIDASIEGTEALIAVDAQNGDSFVLEREGTVLARDRRGTSLDGSSEITLSPSNFAQLPAAFATTNRLLGVATRSNIPKKFRNLLFKPDRATDCFT